MSEIRRIVGVSPTSRGFGFAVLESPENLVDWGLAHVRPPEPRKVACRAVELLERHRPDLLVLPTWEGSRYGERSREVLELVGREASARKVEVLRMEGEEVRRRFSDVGLTKHDRAVALAERFPELSSRLPKKRRPWQTQDERLAVFDAAMLVIASDLQRSQE